MSVALKMQADLPLARADIIEMAYDVLDELAVDCTLDEALKHAWAIRRSVARRYEILLHISLDQQGYIVYT